MAAGNISASLQATALVRTMALKHFCYHMAGLPRGIIALPPRRGVLHPSSAKQPMLIRSNPDYKRVTAILIGQFPYPFQYSMCGSRSKQESGLKILIFMPECFL